MTLRVGVYFISLWFLSSAAVANAATSELSCSMKLTVRGNIQSFWLWGTDTWEGEGEIECLRAGQRRWSNHAEIHRAPVFARFEGWGPGYGATSSSEVQLTLDGFYINDISEIYGAYRTLGGQAKVASMTGQFVLMTQSQSNRFIWSVTPTTRAANTSAFLQVGQMILLKSRPTPTVEE